MKIGEENEWSTGKEVTIGLITQLSAEGVSHVVHAGVTGKVAIHAGIAVATVLTAVVAPPVAIAGGIIAGGTAGVATSLAVSAATEAAFDRARDALNLLLAEQRELPVEEQVGDGLFRFCHVVKEPDVRAAYVSALKIGGKTFPNEDPERALHQITMTQATAEAYFAALHAKFSTSKLATSEERQLEILGGFTLPSAHASIANLLVVEFTPLHMREKELGFGCLVNQAQDTSYWRTKYAECTSRCAQLSLKNRPERDCIHECHRLLQIPRNAEEEIYGKDGLYSAIKASMEKSRRKVFVSKDKTSILRSSRAAGLASAAGDAARLSSRGKYVELKSWDVHDFTASVFVGLSGDYVELPTYIQFPLEVLLEKEGGEPLFTETHRVMFQSLQFGECWSRSGSNSIWNSTRSIVAGGAWCHASNHVPGSWCKDRNKNCHFNFGKVCTPNVDRCALVNQQPPEPPFYCVD